MTLRIDLDRPAREYESQHISVQEFAAAIVEILSKIGARLLCKNACKYRRAVNELTEDIMPLFRAIQKDERMDNSDLEDALEELEDWASTL